MNQELDTDVRRNAKEEAAATVVAESYGRLSQPRSHRQPNLSELDGDFGTDFYEDIWQ